MQQSRNQIFNSPDELFDALRDRYAGMRNLLTATWSVDVKREMADDLKRLTGELEEAVKHAKRRKRGDEANAWRAAQVFLKSIEAELQMWLCINRNEPHAAWDHFIIAEHCALQAAGWLEHFEPAHTHSLHLAEVERVIFPKLIFLSSSLILAEEDQFCGLCDSVYGTCGHIAGELYDGDVATREARNVRAVREVSIVDSPSSKHCRVFNIGGVDPLTGEPSQTKENADKN